ncbi:septum formation family protein [Nocardioides mangrovicus]|uniref:septum formation family protein n=1 Tax=Nocardioides mangrovicus TaxID=2478913 RepID=UPI001314BA32|nr:septum formation family protein [Nocardioides mangrovicus]
MLLNPGRLAHATLLLAVVAAGCGTTAPARTAAPADGTCRSLTPRDVARSNNDSPRVACSRRHTAQTYLVGRFPASLRRAAYGSSALGRYVYGVCQPAFVAHLGGDESIALRSLFSWAWFGPSKPAWAARARWFRCDVVGGPEDARAYRSLPRTTAGALAARPPEDWMACARGTRLAGAPRVPCSQAHTWRAVTTIKVGQPQDAWPGERIAQVRSQQFCSDSVGGWLGYPTTDYRYGSSVVREADWAAGERRSVCWAATTR